MSIYSEEVKSMAKEIRDLKRKEDFWFLMQVLCNVISIASFVWLAVLCVQ